jgi:hypothetical protein
MVASLAGFTLTAAAAFVLFGLVPRIKPAALGVCVFALAPLPAGWCIGRLYLVAGWPTAASALILGMAVGASAGVLMTRGWWR